MLHKPILAVILPTLLMLSLHQEANPKPRPGVLIQQMVAQYGINDPGPRLKELETVDPEAAEQWTEIFQYWDYANKKMPMNYEIPQDLPTDNTLCFIVLGYQLNPDGTMRDELLGRLQTAKKCAELYPNSFVLCTGGGTADGNKSATEAGVMARWLRKNGIASKRILTEANSLTTTENAIFSCDLLAREQPQVTSVVMVSSDYHIPWGAVLFQTQFILSGRPTRIVSNAAFQTSTHYFSLNYQRSGILKIAGIV